MNAPADAFDFDAWRRNYDSMTYQDHLDTYGELQQLYPMQQHFDDASCWTFLEQSSPRRVLEVGGWDGELAKLMLCENQQIEAWENVEVCKHVVDHPVCTDDRYNAHTTSDFAWICGCFDHAADTLVMSHCAEHMRWSEFQLLVVHLPKVRAIYLAMPLPVDGSNPDWNGYPGTHILEVGWDTVGAFLGGLGFRQMANPRTHEVRCWLRPDAPRI